MNAAEVRQMAWRLGAQTAVLLVGCVLLVAVTVYVVVDRSAAADAREQVRSVAAALDDPAEAPAGVWVVILAGGERTASAELPAGLPIEADLTATAADGAAREREVVLATGHALVRTVRVGDRVVQAAVDEEEYEAERNRLLGALAVAGLVGIGGALAAGVLLARRSLRPLAQTMALQRRFVADASHELRTPLTLLSTRVQLLARRLRRGQPASELDEEIDGVLGDARRLADILDDLLVAADPRAHAEVSAVDLADLAAQAAASARAGAEEKGIQVEASGSGSTVVLGAESALRRAVVALIDNALEHAEQRVEVGVVGEGRWVRVEVTDDGPGIPEDLLGGLFERFASGHRESSGRRHYGLGLALVAEIAHSHRGRVDAANLPDHRGARLRLSLPAQGRSG